MLTTKLTKDLVHIARMVRRGERINVDYDEAYSEYIDLVLNGEPFDYSQTKLWRFVQHTGMVQNKVNYITKVVPALILSIKNNGIVNPLEIRGNEVITGNQRLAIARKLGIKELECVDKMKTDLSTKEAHLQGTFIKQLDRRKGSPRWRGVDMIKLPSDIVMYQMAIFERKPDFIVEIGSAYGASALMFADFLNMAGGGTVISIDPTPRAELPKHPNIIWLKGDSKDPKIIKQIKRIVGNSSVMVSIDGDHSYTQVKAELELYKDIVTPSQYMVIEDSYGKLGQAKPVMKARDEFLSNNKDFIKTDFCNEFLVAVTKNGWILRKGPAITFHMPTKKLIYDKTVIRREQKVNINFEQAYHEFAHTYLSGNPYEPEKTSLFNWAYARKHKYAVQKKLVWEDTPKLIDDIIENGIRYPIIVHNNEVKVGNQRLALARYFNIQTMLCVPSELDLKLYKGEL